MIKKHRNKNDYYYAGEGLWVRNFTKKVSYPIDINNLIESKDMQLLLNNESSNKSKTLQGIDSESFSHSKIAIINSGYNFEANQEILKFTPPDVVFIGINDVMNKWKVNRRLHYYVANNPYKECMDYLPHSDNSLRPKCIVSTRTNPDFISAYDGLIYKYTPVHDTTYAGAGCDTDYSIDDYRNALCAAIGLAYNFKVKKLLLCFPDEAYKEAREACVKVKDNMWMYPQQMTAHKLIDGNLYWLKEAKTKVAVHANIIEYNHATYIGKENFADFFS